MLWRLGRTAFRTGSGHDPWRHLLRERTLHLQRVCATHRPRGHPRVHHLVPVTTRQNSTTQGMSGFAHALCGARYVSGALSPRPFCTINNPATKRGRTCSEIMPKRRNSAGKGNDRHMGFYDDLGVRAVINAAGTLTRLGGSRLAPEVLAA